METITVAVADIDRAVQGTLLALGVPAADASTQSRWLVARLSTRVAVPRTLAENGIPVDALPGLAEQALTITRLLRNSPRPLDRDALLEILNTAHRGELIGLSPTNGRTST